MSVELAVVIPCTRPERVVESLDALAGQPGAEGLEVFVVGDRPDPPPAPRWPFEVTWLAMEQRHANLRRNAGIEGSTAPRIAILDDDAVPEHGWLEAALTVAPGELLIRTGPEQPYRTDRTARLAWAVLASPVGEVSGGHHARRAAPVAWYRVPFSNFVASREVFDRVGLPAVDIPWDMDDFEFCLRARHDVAFEADPLLRVRHDRYPSSLRQFLGYVKRLRVRTGEKVVTHPGVYLRIPAVAACAAVPWLAAPALVFPPVWAAASVGYAGLLASQVPHAARLVGWRRVPAFLGLMAAVHGLTVAGVQVGIARAGLRKLRGADVRAADASDHPALLQ